MICAGQGKTKDATKEIQDLIDMVKQQVLSFLTGEKDDYKAVTYSEKIVAGRNYFVKIKVMDDECVHVRIHQPLGQDHANLKVVGVQQGKKQEDELVPF